GYDSFNADDQQYAGEYVAFETEAGSCYLIEGDVNSGSYDRSLVKSHVPTADGFILYLSYETENGEVEKRYTLTYSVDKPEKLLIQYPDRKVPYTAQ
ncbi:MAG: hypothetical protein II126_00925, partial [Erysipelotrichaceae bacterium]|nr:hypothetical protein [Erysipelotrichaceae bacterium]